MAPEVCYCALLLAFFVSGVQSATLFIASRRHDPTAAFADSAALVQFMFLVVAFAALIYAFITFDFSVEVLAANAHTAKPLLCEHCTTLPAYGEP